jgi:NADH dehydrogenase/NADH:ubiquinone oxidoreductase subunit G
MAKVNRYSSYRTMSAYEATTAWASKRKAMRQEFEGRQSAANNAFINAASSKIDGMGTLIGQKALDRVIAEGKVKAEKNAALAKLATEIDSNKADIKDSMFSDSTSGQLDSGTKIDLNAGTITLSDGTVIDSKTGAKKINIVT